MQPEMWITLIILIAAITLFITEWVRLDVVALGVIVSLVITEVLTLEQGLAGFASKPVFTIASLFIVGGAVFHTGLANVIAARILRIAGSNQTQLLVFLMVSISIMSAFISSTGVVALMLPAVLNIALKLKIAPSKLLIPMAYSALMGGTITLIGTPPNVIASDTLVNGGFEPLGFFSIAPLGVLVLLAGVGYMLTFGQRLMPDRRIGDDQQHNATAAELFEFYRLSENLFRLKVPAHSSLVDTTIADSRLRPDFGLTIVRIERPAQRVDGLRPAIIPTAAREETLAHPGPDEILQAEDILIIEGTSAAAAEAAKRWNLTLMTNQPVGTSDLITPDIGIAEVLLRPRSNLIGRTIKDVEFGTNYRLTVLEIRRPGGEGQTLDVKDTPLKFGDMLLVQGEWKDIFALKKLRHDFVVMGEPEAAMIGAFSNYRKAPLALIILTAMVVVIALNLIELTLASMLTALAMVLTGCLKMDEAYESIDWKSLVLIAGMLPMATALEKVGLVSIVATGFAETLGSAGPVVVLAGLFLLTMVFTQMLSNTATAVLITPIALATALQIDVAPQAFVVGVAFATSMAFATPVASPVNTLVMTPGNYRFVDYMRVGAPMLLISLIIAVLVLPLLWPF